ncbi:F-box-like domain-containing protein [Purpureocillium lilacinum]|uniref:F-box-like domain-containing protein n=1 Tax=Purpureocillium lilacinum TaxID=33203 RepID=A0A179HM75_PURLI|nr:F-box-like domain-containing protein [Purpureocillium lilacinum]OAQ91526.1 F-box-like domain-containing protein [Purpureocillium lilacinum]
MEDDIDGLPPTKRKSSASCAAAAGTSSKRLKLAQAGLALRAEAPPDVAHHLPAEIWHRVFTFLPPKSLGSLLRVNKLFRGYLGPRSGGEVNMAPAHTARSPALSPMKPDAIWRASRRFFWPQMPGPLQGKSEVDMWRLCCARSCQLCGFRDTCGDAAKAQDQWHRGPGAKGVVPVFPLSMALCGSCLVERTVKEIDVFLSNTTPSFLVTGLPMVFITAKMHVIAPQVLSVVTSPGKTQITKVFLGAHVEEIRLEFETVKGLGRAAAEEWVKGLDARGKKLLVDASRWERWFLSGGVQEMHELIRDKWSDGDRVSKKEASQFAADVLLYVRKRFYAQIAEKAAARRAAGKQPIVEPPEGPWTQKLTLENMKWVFDMKIKQHTDRHRKELFVCNVCQGPRKLFGLESVIQHYAAKHTTALSVGNVVVHWRAEWPETPIFDPDPKQKRPKAAPGSSQAPPAMAPVSHGLNGVPALPPAPYPPPGVLDSTYGYGLPTQSPMHMAYFPGMGLPAVSYPGQDTPAPCHPTTTPAWSQYGISHPPPPAQPIASGGDGTSSSGIDDDRRAVKPAALTNKKSNQDRAKKLNFASKAAQAAWKQVLNESRESSDAERAVWFMNHVADKYEMEFGPMSLDVFKDALMNRRGFRPARELARMGCKACQVGRNFGDKPRYFRFPELLDHFKTLHDGMRHMDGSDRRLNWRDDMVLSQETITVYGQEEESNAAVEHLELEGKYMEREKPGETKAAHPQRDGSSSDSYEPEYDPEDIPINTEPPVQMASGRPLSDTAVDHAVADVPNLRPASAVYRSNQPPRNANGSKHRRGRAADQNAGRPEPGVWDERNRREPVPATPARIDEDGFEILGSLQSRLGVERRVPTAVGVPARDGRREALTHDIPPRGEYIVEHEYAPQHPHDGGPLRIARTNHYAEQWHPEPSRTVAYHSPAYYSSGEPVPYRGYADDPRAQPVQAHGPPEAYEIVEVRDPQGDYLIRRPIRLETVPPLAYYAHEGVAYVERGGARQGTVFDDSYHRYPQHHHGPPPSTHAPQGARPQRPPSRMDLEEYDPRFPAPTAPAAGGVTSGVWHEPSRGV